MGKSLVVGAAQHELCAVSQLCQKCVLLFTFLAVDGESSWNRTTAFEFPPPRSMHAFCKGNCLFPHSWFKFSISPKTYRLIIIPLTLPIPTSTEFHFVSLHEIITFQFQFQFPALIITAVNIAVGKVTINATMLHSEVVIIRKPCFKSQPCIFLFLSLL